MKQNTHENEQTIGPSIMVYGLRDTGDAIFEEELNSMIEEKVLKELILAYSRKEETSKTYCQDILKERKDLLKAFIEDGPVKGNIYICGSTGLKNGCLEVLRSEFYTDDELNKMIVEKRLCFEAWG